MAPVINDNIKFRPVLFKAFPEVLVSLASNKNFYLPVLKFFARLLNIRSVHSAVRPKIISPHLQTSAAVYSYFKNMNFLSNKCTKMTMIHVKVMIPLHDPMTAFTGKKILPKRICNFFFRLNMKRFQPLGEP